MNIVDSSAWLEYFADGKNAEKFAETIENEREILIPVIVLYEVFKKLLSELGEEKALPFVEKMSEMEVVTMDSEIAVLAGKISHKYKLPMADSIIMATAHKYGAQIWTQDSDLEGFSNVKYFAKS